MAHLFDALTGNIENQSAIQSILDTQPVTEAAQQAEDEDVFQCGKCKKQFTILSMFLTHKQGPCSPLGPRPIQPSIQGLQTNSANSAFTAHRPSIQQPVPASPLTQLTHNMVLMDDQMLTFSDVQSLQTGLLQASSLLPGNAVQATGPFLSQVTQLAPRASNNITIISPVQSSTSLAPSNGSAFTSTTAASNLQPLVQNGQQITIATVPEKQPATPMIIKPSPTKAGRKSAQAIVISALEDQAAGRAKTATIEDTSAGKKKLHCQYCRKGFSKNFDLQQHIRAHTGEKPYQCVVCGRAFAQKSNVKKHMATHKVWPTGSGGSLPSQPPALLIPVENSDETPEQQGDSLQQIVTVSATQPVIQEDINKQQISQEVQDVPVPTANPPAESPESNQPGGANYKLRVVIDNSYLCQYCPEKFKSYFQLKTHMVKHKSEQVYKCVVKNCPTTFKDLDSFLEHTSNHQDDMTFRCHLCGKNFPSLHELGIHQYTHSLYQQTTVSKSGPRYFQCTKCINKYSTPEALEHHMNTCDHNFPCPHCQKSFSCERFLRRHLTSHGTEGLYTCHTCNKSFKTEHYLKSHFLIHTGEKPFECEICGATFNRKDKLKRHNLIHDRKVHYKCPFRTVTGCTKEFNRADKLKSHIITHSGIKPYRCATCGKDFARRPHLREHEKGHTGDYTYKCEKCGKGFFRPKLLNQHKCFSQDGQVIPKRVFKPRMNRRKAGRPRKRMITITDSKTNPFLSVPVDSPTIKSRSQRAAKSRMKRSQVGKLNDEQTSQQNTELETENSSAGLEAEEVEDAIVVMASSTSSASKPAELFSAAKSTPTLTVTSNPTVTVVGDPAMIVKETKEEIVEIKIPETAVISTLEDKASKLKKPKQECYVKAPPASLMEQFVTVHLANTSDADSSIVQAHLIPAIGSQAEIHIPSGSTTAQIQISPSANSAFQPITILESQPLTLTVSQQEQLQSLGVTTTDVIDIPVDIVTVSDEQAIVCSEVVNTGPVEGQTYSEVVGSGAADQQVYIRTAADVNTDTANSSNYAVAEQAYVNNDATNEPTYVTCDEQIEDFGTTEGDVLQGADNLMNAAVEILPSAQVHEISLANVQ